VLNRSHRLLSSDDFRRVFRRGRKAPVSGGLIVFSENDVGYSRWGFVVSKGVGSAVTRNLVKRRLRAAARQIIPDLAGVDVVVRANAQAPQIHVEEWVSALHSALKRHGL
jgi:ribonuclease P protein component